MTSPLTPDPPLAQADFHRRPRFAAPPTFAGLPRGDEVGDLTVGILGIPFDAGVTYRPGARFGPEHIRSCSKLLRPYHPDLDARPFGTHQIADLGDLGVTPFSITDAVTDIQHAAEGALERSDYLLTLGGDHTIALPLLRALAKRHGPLAVVHFDAHLDTWGSYFGASINHGSPFRRAAEERLLDPEGCIHIGTRGSLYGVSDITDDRSLGFAVARCEQLEREGFDAVIEASRRRVANRPVYISIDIDVLDPAFAPATGTPEPGGLTSRELLSILRRLRGLNIIGADIVEVAPAYDHAQITGFAAAHLAYELLGLWAAPARPETEALLPGAGSWLLTESNEAGLSH